jgi:signal transduction histidine kinase/CHASE3 domain sensor protein/ActR/RegA family two-component response regulator
MVMAGGLSFYNLHRLTMDNAWVEHTYQVMQALDNFLSCLTSTETAQRGFSITGDESYVESLQRNMEATRHAAAQIVQMTADNPEQRSRLSSLTPLLSQRFAALEDMVAARRADADITQLRRISEGGLSIGNGIHALVGNLYASEQELLRVRSRRAADSANAAHLGILGCSALGCLFVALSLIAVRRDLTGRNAAERRLREANESLEARVSQRTAELHAQVSRLALLSQVTRSISERQDVRSIFQVVIRTLEEEMPLDFCCICLKDGVEAKVTVSCVGRRSEALALELAMTEHAHVHIGQNGLSHCMRGNMVYEPDLRGLQYPFPQRLAHAGLSSMVAAPLMVESKVFGIVVASRRRPQAFSADECDFVRQVAEHVALATQQAQLVAELQLAYEDLRQSQQSALQRERLRALGQMASGIAHDINNALSPVSLYVESIMSRERALSEESAEQLLVIRRGIDDVARTVARIRAFSRQRDESLGLIPTDLNELVKQVTELTRARWRNMSQRGGVVIDLKTRLDPALPPVLGIEGEIRDALINLIFNAADAMPRGGELVVRTAVKGRRVGLEVIDQGVGMDEDTRRRCLEPFFTTKGERGTGLGLAMVYGAMQRHHGDIEIDSTLGQGTTMRLLFQPAPAASLPVSGQTQTQTSQAQGLAAAASGSKVAPMRVLVVDDDPLILTALRLTLESDGHVVTVADGGAAGVAAFRAALAESRPFPVVMTDLGMPHMDGRQVAAAIKQAAPDTRVLLLTGWAERFAGSSDIPAHVDLVLGKPPKRAELREALYQLMTPPPAAAVVNL